MIDKTAYEARMRRLAARNGFVLRKSRRTGDYIIVTDNNCLVADDLTLDEVQQWLTKLI